MSIITLLVTSENCKSERRFDKQMTIGKLKERLEPLTGFSVGTMKLEVYNKQDQLVALLSEDQMLLGYYPLEDFFRLNVIDTDPFRIKNEFSDVTRVEKFEITEAEYDKRTDSVRHFLQRNKLGKYAEKPDREDLPKYAEEAAVIQVGERCEVETEEAGMKRRGIVMFVGETKFKYGFWVGVEYDEPLGKHDGLVDGERYFKCRPGHGAFVRPNKVVTGDFPELDPFADSDVDEM